MAGPLRSPLLLPLCLAALVAIACPTLVSARFSSIIDDPHFSSPDGVPFDFHGELDKTYCLVTDTRLHINARLHGYKDPGTPPVQNNPKLPTTASLSSQPVTSSPVNRTWMKELGIVWLDHKGVPHRLHMVARTNRRSDRMHGYMERLTLDGHPLALPYDGRRIEKGPMLFQFTGVLKLPREEQESFTLSIGGLLGAAIIMRPAKRQLQTRTDAHVHFNVNFFKLNTTEKVHGVLGQTYRTAPEQKAKSAKFLQLVHSTGVPVQADQESGRGFLDGSIKDYEPTGVTKPDCKVSVFQSKL